MVVVYVLVRKHLHDGSSERADLIRRNLPLEQYGCYLGLHILQSYKYFQNSSIVCRNSCSPDWKTASPDVGFSILVIVDYGGSDCIEWLIKEGYLF